jgi:hypothetical protein
VELATLAIDNTCKETIDEFLSTRTIFADASPLNIVSIGRVDVLRLLVARDYITQKRCDAALTNGLVQAILYCDVELARVMLEAGASANGQTRTGKSLLAKVIRLSNEDHDDEDDDGEIDSYEDDEAFAIVELLVDFGAQVDPQTAIAAHASPLERAVQYGWEQMVRWLLRRGAKPVLHSSILHQRNKRLISEAARRRCKAIVTEEYGGHVIDADLEDSLNSDHDDDDDDDEGKCSSGFQKPDVKLACPIMIMDLL